MSGPPTIRTATAADLPAVAALHRAVFAETMGVALGRGYTHAFLSWFLGRTDAFVLLAEQDHAVVGYALGAAISAERDRNRTLLPAALRGLAVRPWLAMQRRVLVEARTRVSVLLRGEVVETTRVPEPCVSLVGIGVDPAAQGRGIAKLLLAAFHTRAVALGARSIRLSVYDTNARARALYEGQGFASYRHPTKTNVLFYWKETTPQQDTRAAG